MGLIQKLKSALGLDGAGSPDRGTATPRDVDVTVEREPSSESEDAVKGTETATGETAEAAEPDAEAGVAEEPDVDASSTDESTTDEAAADEPLIEQAEESVDDASGKPVDSGAEESVDDDTAVDTAEQTDESGGDESGSDESAGDETTDAAEESVDDGEATATEEPAVGSSDPVTEISGIGPAYGERLSDAGVGTVADLAGADADDLEAETDISASRIQGWIDAATEY